MSSEEERRNALIKEARRVQEDCTYSGKGHYNAASRWQTVHYSIGVPSAVAAAIAGVSAFADQAVLAGVLALIVAAATGAGTFLNPGERSEAHKDAGDRFTALRQRARRIAELDGPDIGLAEMRDLVEELSANRDELNQGSPKIPSFAYEKAKDGIEAGEHVHEVDS